MACWAPVNGAGRPWRYWTLLLAIPLGLLADRQSRRRLMLLSEALRALCDTHGILLIADEIQTGAGRTGTWLAIEQSGGVVPDLITMAKSIGGGYPVAAVIGLPFFGPLWRRETTVNIYPLANDAHQDSARRRALFDGVHFPVRGSDIPARMDLIEPGEGEWRIGSTSVG